MKKTSFVSFANVDFKSGFWHDRYELNKQVSIQNVRKRFEETGRMDALRFNYLKNGKKPHVFFDSDVAKWMEGVAYLMQKDREGMREQEALCEELISCMESAQRDDGYLNSEHQQISPHLIFQDRGRHELYCAGHLIEAAIAYHNATGRDRFLRIMERYCECIRRAFMVDKTAGFVTPGHEEIELALFKLYRHTGNETYKEMAEFFLENRGRVKESAVYIDGDEENRYGTQDDVDIHHLKDANGHCVRAVYFYTGIAEMAKENQDGELFQNLESVFEDIVCRKIYVTGGIGSTRASESFTIPYDLPNQTAYTESCTAVALMRFAACMRQMSKQAKYGHLMERVLYNNMLSSTSQDGKAFFYENPLQIVMEDYNREVSGLRSHRVRLPIAQRVEVFSCSCCPPNINRFFGELGNYICVEDEDGLCVEQYIASKLQTVHGTLEIDGEYAKEGRVTLSSENYTAERICVRVPEWCKKLTVEQNGKNVSPVCGDGYASFEVDGKFTLTLNFHIAPMLLSANPNVRADVGRVALCYGPVVYCLEGVDNGKRLDQIEIDPVDLGKATLVEDFHPLYSITLPAYRLRPKDALYFDAAETQSEPIRAKFIPYYTFANRGASDMQVWVRRHS